MEELPEGFEGLILEGEQNDLQPTRPQAFQGIILSDGYFFETRQVFAFEGIILAYEDPDEKFIKVVTSSGKPFAGVEVVVDNVVNPPFSSVTNQEGYISGIFDLSGLIPVRLKSGNTYFDFEIDGDTQPITSILEFPLIHI